MEKLVKRENRDRLLIPFSLSHPSTDFTENCAYGHSLSHTHTHTTTHTTNTQTHTPTHTHTHTHTHNHTRTLKDIHKRYSLSHTHSKKQLGVNADCHFHQLLTDM